MDSFGIASEGSSFVRIARSEAQTLAPELAGRPSKRQFVHPASSWTKRCFDIAVAALALIALAPLLLLIGAAIKVTSRGPVLFRQNRYGFHNCLFGIYKFRTMYVECSDLSGIRQVKIDDERVTPLGSFLRRFDLDELPQLLNVLKGDMSLVGPRPHVPGMLAAGIGYELLVPSYFDRHLAKPGLTGLAQAFGYRGSTVDADLAVSRIRMDLYYIDRWSMALDLAIIAKTIRYELKHRGSGV